jgi:ketosteroid isomerase-like protein
MSTDQEALQTLIAKEQIRELALLYSRGVDRKDVELLKTLYTKDGTDHHGDRFSGSADDYIKFLERSMPHMPMSGHHICNHLISVSGNEGEGEVYAIAFHVLPDGKGGYVEDLMCVRYIDRYRKEADGRWRFVTRVVTFDHRAVRPLPSPQPFITPDKEPSYETLKHRLFARGARP